MSASPRREVYRQSKRLIVKLLLSRWEGTRHSLEGAVRRFLRNRQRRYLLRLLRDKAAALSAAALILLASQAHAGPLVRLSDVASGNGGFIISGGGSFGFAVSGGTDVNGDGFADVAVGAPTGVYGGVAVGKAYVVFGKSDSNGVNVSNIESGSGGIAIFGNSTTRPIGGAVSCAGLINDGPNPEVVVGSNQIAGGTDARTYVVHGGAAATVDLTDVENATGGFVITGTESIMDGQPIVYAFGDINGDGRDDVAIGAPYGNSFTGRVYVVFGKANTTPVSAANIVAGSGGFVVNGALGSDRAGKSVSIVGDMTGDGRDELVIGAPGATGSAFYSGRAFVVFGKSSGTAVDLADVAKGTGGFVVDGQHDYDFTGSSVAGLGDVNGDGLNDIAIGGPTALYNYSTADGRTYVVFGKTSTTAVSLFDIAAGTGGFAINGRTNTGKFSGHAVSRAGDVNSDGLADILIGTNVNSSQGEAYVVFGKSNTDPVHLDDVFNGVGGIPIVGISNVDRAGYAVSGAGDVNGDGADDVIIGSPGNNKAYVVFGPASAPVTVGLTSSASGDPIASGIVYIERTDAPVGFRAPLAGIVDGSALYQSQFADIGDFNVTAIASDFLATDPVLVSNDGSVPGIQLDPDPALSEPNILTVVVRVLNQQGQVTGQRVLTKTAQLRIDTVPLDITPVYGQGEMIFVGAPSGAVEIFIPDTAQYDFVPKTVDLGTGVQETVIVDAMLLDGAAPRASLPGLVVGSVLNGNSDPIDVYPEPLVIHTLDANNLSTSTDGTVDGAFVFPDVNAGSGVIQAFSGDGTIAGSTKSIFVVSGEVYGDEVDEDTLLSVNPASGDADADGLPDDFENTYLSTVPTSLRGPDDDPDLDGLTNFDEFVASTLPANADSDSDGEQDGVELVLGADPNDAASQPGPQSTVYVDFGFVEPLKAGLLLNPYTTMNNAIEAVADGGEIRIKGDVAVTAGEAPAGPITKAVQITAVNGTVRIE